MLISASYTDFSKLSISPGLEVYFPEQAEKLRLVVSENQEINSIENLLLKEAENETSDISKVITDTPKRNIVFGRAIIKLECGITLL
jgi:hypothetical protein